jgi:hypothetical protein
MVLAICDENERIQGAGCGCNDTGRYLERKVR